MKFSEDLEIWVNSSNNSTTFGTNQASYTLDTGVTSEENIPSSISYSYEHLLESSGGFATFYWNMADRLLEVTPGEYSLDNVDVPGLETIGLLLINGINTTDREGTNLGSESFNIPI